MWAFMPRSRSPIPSMFGLPRAVEGDLPGKRDGAAGVVVVVGVEVELSEDGVLVGDPREVTEGVGRIADGPRELLGGPEIGEREDGPGGSQLASSGCQRSVISLITLAGQEGWPFLHTSSGAAPCRTACTGWRGATPASSAVPGSRPAPGWRRHSPPRGRRSSTAAQLSYYPGAPDPGGHLAGAWRPPLHLNCVTPSAGCGGRPEQEPASARGRWRRSIPTAASASRIASRIAPQHRSPQAPPGPRRRPRRPAGAAQSPHRPASRSTRIRPRRAPRRGPRGSPRCAGGWRWRAARRAPSRIRSPDQVSAIRTAPSSGSSVNRWTS